MEWLGIKFEQGASYISLNTYRSALSFLCGEYIGKSPMICRLLKGIYKLRPSKPKYDRIYSLDSVLNKLERMHPLNNFNLDQLTTKVVIFLSLITAQRKQTLSLIKRSNIKKTNSGFEIEISDSIKTSRPGASQPFLILNKFNENSKLCVVSVLEEYIKVTELLITTDFLFITIKRSHKVASKDTISRWIRAFLVEGGISSKFT
ncbi:GSCOCG00012210001-RA-CDS [Cotesia congregata]|nr:GSCOCG00012210001-RA-CDS [Cotesia congregata]